MLRLDTTIEVTVGHQRVPTLQILPLFLGYRLFCRSPQDTDLLNDVGNVCLFENVLEALGPQMLAPIRLAELDATRWKPGLHVELERLEDVPLDVVHTFKTSTPIAEELSHHELVTTEVIEARDDQQEGGSEGCKDAADLRGKV